MSEFVEPRVKRIPLSGEDRWIEIKEELSQREERHIWTRLVKDGVITAGEKIQLDPEQVGLTKVVEYLLDWSFVDAQGHPIPVSESSINNLKPATYKEISTLIDAHDEANRQADEDLLKNRPGATGSKATSASVAP